MGTVRKSGVGIAVWAVSLTALAGLLACSRRVAEKGAARPASSLGFVQGAGEGREATEGLASPGEELWVIERTREEDRAATIEKNPVGMLCRRDAQPEVEVPLPLKHTDVRARIEGYISTVEVTQQYHNPYDGKIEAVYVFPLPHDAAVNDFLITIGERKIRGIIREREEAKRIYEEAKSQGYVATLLTQERPNVFTQSVANIEPGKEIDVRITYFHTLPYVDGAYEFVFPTVVGPRFNPPGQTDGIGAVPRGRPGISGPSTEVPYLKPGETSAHDLSLSVDLDAGMPVEALTCATHAIVIERPSANRAKITLSPTDAVPDKDFVLRYAVAGREIKSGVVVHRDERGGFFSMMIVPPADLSSLVRQPVEMVFVLDCSGSMEGAPLAKAKQAIERAIRKLQPDDSFQIMRFSDTSSQMSPAPAPATADHVRRGLKYLASLESEGGTMMIEGIRAALGFPRDPERSRIVSFMTDGYIGNEAEIFAETQRLLGSTRLFSFGVGSSVNRYLLEGLARMGNGAVAYVGLDEQAGTEVDRFYDRIRHPVVTGLSIDGSGTQIHDVYPRRIPDLFVGRPVILTGRFEGTLPREIRVRGRAAGRDRTLVVSVPEAVGTDVRSGLPSIWARTKIADLSDFAGAEKVDSAAREVTQLALQYNLMSAFTSFVAVDSSHVTAGAQGTTVPVAVPVPEGVKYETTVPVGQKQ